MILLWLIKALIIPDQFIVLTFDDGPVKGTLPLLDVLKKYDTKGLFFMVGREVDAHVDIGKRVIREGHEVGSHSYTHGSLEKMDRRKAIGDVWLGHWAIVSDLGIRPKYFRPPNGISTGLINTFLREHRIRKVMWDFTSGDIVYANRIKHGKRDDWATLETTRLWRHVVMMGQEGLILMHDVCWWTKIVVNRFLLRLYRHNCQVGISGRIVHAVRASEYYLMEKSSIMKAYYSVYYRVKMLQRCGSNVAGEVH